MIQVKTGKSVKTHGQGLRLTQKESVVIGRKRKSRLSVAQAVGKWPMPYNEGATTEDALPYEPNGLPEARSTAQIKGAAESKMAQAHTIKTRRGPAKEREEDREGAATDCVKMYFNGIKRFKLLTTEEEKTLATSIAKGDMEARRRMIETNLRLVVNIAKRYQNRGLPLQDLIEEGNIGLIKSVERFKATKECKFSTYATYWIKQAVERAIANQSGIVRLPIHVTADMSKVARATKELTLSLKREPSVSELSKRTGLSGRYVKKLSTISRKSYSLEAGFPDDTDQPLLDRFEDERVVPPMVLIDESRRVQKINDWLAQLDSNESTILRLRFGLENDEPQTLESIGAEFGVTRERVRQIEVKALDKLRKMMHQSNITAFDSI